VTKYAKRHFNPIAAAVHDAVLALGVARVTDEQRKAAMVGVELVVVHLSALFSIDNPAFTAERFKQAALLGETECKKRTGGRKTAATSNPSAQLTFDLETHP
jgi:hypothetical protein